MPEGRAERAVEAPAKSMDGAEHSARIERVMAGGSSDQGKRILRRENARDSRLRFRLELPSGSSPESSRPSCVDLSGTRDVSDPL